MKALNILKRVTIFGLMLVMASTALAQQTVNSRIGDLSFTKDFANGYPTHETVTKLYDEMDFQRACQAYMWSIPLVSFVWWQEHQIDVLGSKNGQLIYAETYDEKVSALTLNTTTPYVWGFVDLQESGPYVVEVPPGGQVRGAVSDMWQIQMTQLTRPGKYLFIGPNQELPVGAESEGYIISHSPMNNFFVGFRLMSEDEKTRTAMLDKVKIYPYSDRKNPKKLKPIRPGNKVWHAHQPRRMD